MCVCVLDVFYQQKVGWQCVVLPLPPIKHFRATQVLQIADFLHCKPHKKQEYPSVFILWVNHLNEYYFVIRYW